MVSHVRRVMEAAVNLKDVYLYDRLACKFCFDHEPLRTSTFRWSIKKRASMKKLITQGMEPRARIHFLKFAEIYDYHLARLKAA